MKNRAVLFQVLSGCWLFVALSLAMAAPQSESREPAGIPLTRAIASGPFEPTWESFKQYRCPDWFRDAKFGIWAHWGPGCEPEQGDWYARRMYEQGSDIYNYHVAHYGHPSQFGFKDIIHEWKAEHWDPEKLMALYKRAGAKFFVAMAVHHDNFDLYDSSYQPWNSVNVGPRTDIVGRWQAAARHQGLRFGVSTHSAPSWNWWYASMGSDREGALAGVPYDGNLTKADGKGKWWDGLDPRDLYPPIHPGERIKGNPQNEAYIQKWFLRTQELMDKYKLDYFYHDYSDLPFGQSGLDLAAHFYNSSLSRSGGKMDVVMTTKNLSEDKRGSMVQDIERGASDKLEPYPWETGTCIGNWHYDRRIFEEHRYKTVIQIVQILADVVSKNGTLLLSIPVRADGTLDSDEESFLDGMGKWMDVNAESIIGTRPWKMFGEGPTNVKPGEMGEKDLRFTSRDIRFTTKQNVLYAIILDWPSDNNITIRALATSSSQLGGLKAWAVSLLGSPEKVEWSSDDQGLHVKAINKPAAGSVVVLKIVGVL